ncbi:anhydro-N-acetylmuramic acid kinase [Alteromonas lipolytica]|uniref:Anhydro-N-acetylmuramic acid kinase n=1 Tax=Alteromonas lipolytica TaxID=1856405 RepID=A0A1E8F9Z7_9ALTE|nr:anhydro-N-acetylmuramic acid kinase [Alteromonas lipolytica]OFI32737.1 anhydro-N-acetylmuramic acid kinase [Alteromonas lipolytica]GGF73530.1 anhydro-N-acetylmuramic acid kinase [Alteromonas lipolytica]
MAYFIGVMSGTSMDGVDAILTDITDTAIAPIAAVSVPYPEELLDQLHQLCIISPNEINHLGQADRAVAKVFAQAVNKLIAERQLSPADIRAVGSHGQTVRHYPDGPPGTSGENGFTLQIGDPGTIAALTGIDVVADFRRKDIAFGGQGAPLVPAFHAAKFAKAGHNRVIVNIGGFANLTVLRGLDSSAIKGFDTGPGNVLMDAWCRKHRNTLYDVDGHWAASGKVYQPLLNSMLADGYFAQTGPKSTGREHFNLTWLQQHLQALDTDLAPQDVQATLLALTATTIAKAIEQQDRIEQCFVCGGGAFNKTLIAKLKELLPQISVAATDNLDLHPQWVEGVAFAWLAWAYMHRVPGNVPSVTGASRAVVLGNLTLAD